MKLVIVESPAKAKTIQKYLGKDYIVKASKGHVVDLPKSGLGVDVDQSYAPEYTITKPAVVKELKQSIKKADTLVLAVDPDREGEAIGWHIAQTLKVINASGKKLPKSPELQRIVFTEVTKPAVQAAAANPRQIDMNLVNAQQARRILDRLVGYKLSPLLWKKIRYGLSAGRVQSVAVRLIVDREAERDKFKADEYWDIKANIAADKSKVNVQFKLKADTDEEEEKEDLTFNFKLFSKADGKKIEIDTEKFAKKIISEVENNDWIVKGLDTKEQSKQPSPPFSTSTMQQTAAGRLKFSASRTMKIAQQLYEAGFITYMRTDSLHISNEAITAVREMISSKWGKTYLPEQPNVYKTKSKVAQEAHEAIRPTNFDKSAQDLGLSGDEARLYDLIWSRTVASQMSSARIQVDTLQIVSEDYVWQGNARKILFPGYLKVFSDAVTERELPKLEIGKKVYPTDIQAEQHFTQPPPRFSEASLIKELEKLGIGRPSTYAPILHTIQQRGYVEKTGSYFIPTDTGKVVTSLLTKHFPEIVDTAFTAGMEDQLDDVANGTLEWVKMIDKFYKPFEKEITTQDKEIARGDYTVLGDSDKPCPVCGKPMVIKLGKNGRFLSCRDFPTCKGMADISGQTEEDIQKKATSVEFLKTYLPAPKTDAGVPYLLRKGRFGEFWAHPDYPKVKDAKPLEMLPEKLAEIYGEPPKTDDGRPYLLKSGRFGKFWAHPDYPKVKDIVKVKKQPKPQESNED